MLYLKFNDDNDNSFLIDELLHMLLDNDIFTYTNSITINTTPNLSLISIKYSNFFQSSQLSLMITIIITTTTTNYLVTTTTTTAAVRYLKRKRL